MEPSYCLMPSPGVNIIIGDPIKQRRVTKELIRYVIEEYFDIPFETIKSKSRVFAIRYPRHLTAYFCNKHLTMTLEQIAKYVGVKDHTTVINSLKTIDDWLFSDEKVKKDVLSITSKILYE